MSTQPSLSVQVNLAAALDDTEADALADELLDELLDAGTLVGAGATGVGDVQAARINSKVRPIPAMRNIRDILFFSFSFFSFASCEKSYSCELHNRGGKPYALAVITPLNHRIEDQYRRRESITWGI
jgi:hypothetical protein